MAVINEHTPLRILMTTDTVGGVWSYSIDICRSLASYGVEFCLVTTGAVLNKSQRDELEQLSNVTVYETDFLLEWMKDPWESIDASKEWLLRLEQAWQPDIVHLNCFAYGGLSWKAPTIAVAHSDVFSWWRNVKGEEPPAAWTEYYNRVKEGMNSVDLLIAPSRVKLKSLNSIYNLQTASKVIYNSRSSSQFTPATKERFVFSMGRIWDEAKNVRLLVDAATGIKYPIRIAGENQFQNNRVDAAHSNVTYLGKLASTEVAEQLSKASLYVLPAKYEPFGLSVLEAALSGCTLVLGKIDSLQELWEGCAVFVDTHDTDNLAATVNYLMRNDAVRSRYAEKAHVRARYFSPDRMAANYFETYQQLLQEHAPVIEQQNI